MKRSKINTRLKQFLLQGCLLGVFLFFMTPGVLSGQYRIYTGGAYEFIYPVNGLGDRFEGIETPVFSAGWDVDAKARIMLEYRMMTFDEINREDLPYDTLRMSLKNHSGGLLYQYEVWEPVPWISLYVQAGITLNQWEFRREPFTTVIDPDSVTTFVPEEISLDVHRRRDWSWGAKAGAGVEISPLRWLHVGWHFTAHLIAAELWPTESLGMESVSGLKVPDHQIYLRVSYGW